MTDGWPIIVSGRLQSGAIKLDANRLGALLKHRRDCELEVIIERKHATRSLAQNALYWGVYVKLLSEHTGYTSDEIHDILKAKFLPKKMALAGANGEITDEFVIGGSTARLNKLEFGEFLRAVQQWAAETLDVVIPDPDDALGEPRKRQEAHA